MILNLILLAFIAYEFISTIYYDYYVAYKAGRFPPGKENNLNAVSRFESIEDYYQRIRARGFRVPPLESPLKRRRIAETKAICKSILGSYYFEMRGEEYLDVDDEEVRNELRSNYPRIHFSLFRKIRNLTGPQDVDDDYKYMNNYVVKSVSFLDRIQPEYVIMCLARGIRSRIIRAYFVTQPYNVNLVPRSKINISGRFIFARRSNNHLGLVAMAEESAHQHELLHKLRMIHVAHLVHVTKRKLKGKIARVPQEDPLCSLSASNKLRLCTSLFGAAVFKQKGFKFTPTPRNVLGNCVRRRIVWVEPIFNRILLLERLGRVISKGLPHEEWTIGCKASTSEGDETVFYVSGTGEPNEILVYTRFNEPGYVVLYNAFHNVSVVDEMGPYFVEPGQNMIFEDVED